jgi:cell division protein FtsQ
MKRAKLMKMLTFMILSLVLIGFIGFVEKQTSFKTFQGTEVRIEGVSGLYFVEESEILAIISQTFPDLKSGLMIEDVKLREIESRLQGHPFVKSVEAMLGQKGILNLKISQHQPIGRIARPLAADGYITTEGKVIPTSNSYTSRVLILEGDFAEQLMEKGDISKEMPELMDLILFISSDPFWSAQITEVEVNRRDDIKLYQQVGKQVIEFGDASDLKNKFDRISIFYTEIMPRKGWNAYQRVSVKFKDQIVCE